MVAADRTTVTTYNGSRRVTATSSVTRLREKADAGLSFRTARAPDTRMTHTTALVITPTNRRRGVLVIFGHGASDAASVESMRASVNTHRPGDLNRSGALACRDRAG